MRKLQNLTTIFFTTICLRDTVQLSEFAQEMTPSPTDKYNLDSASPTQAHNRPLKEMQI